MSHFPSGLVTCMSIRAWNTCSPNRRGQGRRGRSGQVWLPVRVAGSHSCVQTQRTPNPNPLTPHLGQRLVWDLRGGHAQDIGPQGLDEQVPGLLIQRLQHGQGPGHAASEGGKGRDECMQQGFDEGERMIQHLFGTGRDEAVPESPVLLGNLLQVEGVGLEPVLHLCRVGWGGATGCQARLQCLKVQAQQMATLAGSHLEESLAGHTTTPVHLGS